MKLRVSVSMKVWISVRYKQMKLTDLEPQFYKYDIKVETYSVVDGIWDESRKQYLVADGRTWDEAGRPYKRCDWAKRVSM